MWRKNLLRPVNASSSSTARRWPARLTFGYTPMTVAFCSLPLVFTKARRRILERRAVASHRSLQSEMLPSRARVTSHITGDRKNHLGDNGSRHVEPKCASHHAHPLQDACGNDGQDPSPQRGGYQRRPKVARLRSRSSTRPWDFPRTVGMRGTTGRKGSNDRHDLMQGKDADRRATHFC